MKDYQHRYDDIMNNGYGTFLYFWYVASIIGEIISYQILRRWWLQTLRGRHRKRNNNVFRMSKGEGML